MVTIELEKSPLFMIPGKLHLTVNEPGPIVVDPDTFTEQEKQWISSAHYQNKIKVINSEAAEEAVTQPTAEDSKKLTKQQLDEISKNKTDDVKKLLLSPFGDLKKKFEESKDMALLVMAKELETKKKKPRKSLLKLLNKKIKELESVVASAVGTVDVGDTVTPYGVKRVNKEFVSDVTEEEVKQIIVKRIDQSDFADESEATE